MPVIAFAAQVWSDAVCKNATADALTAGFRFIWSSILIGASCQRQQGAAINKSGVPRSELFIAGTVNTEKCSNSENCYNQTHTAGMQQLTNLGVDKLDMLMLDYPSKSGCAGIVGQWDAFEALYAAGTTRSIAVSNFNADQLACLGSNATVPAVNQLRFSVGTSASVVESNRKLGIVVQSYSPLASGGLISDPLCKSIGSAHGKSSAQVALRWIIQSNATIATQSTNLTHLRGDLDIFDFELTADEMSQLDAHHASLLVA